MWRALGAGALAFLAALVLLAGDDVGRVLRRVDGDERAESGATAWLRWLLVRLGALPAVKRARERERDRELSCACEHQMPELLDILALGLSAGLSFDASLELYCARSETELAREALRALRSWQMGLEDRGSALADLAMRAQSPSLERFSAAVAEALAFGAPLAGTLERQAQTIREEQRARTRQRLEEAPVRMLVPLGTLVVPAMLLAIMGPLLAAALGR